MEIRKLRWTKFLALFIALTVVMMYSVTNVTYAFDGGNNGGYSNDNKGGDRGDNNGDRDHGNQGDQGNHGNHDGDNDDGHDGHNGGHGGDGSGHDGDGSGHDGDGSGHDGDGNGHDGDGNGHDGDGSGQNGGGEDEDCQAPKYDVSIWKTAVEDDLTVGDSVQFNIRITNIGSKDAKDIVITDYWPVGLSQGAVILPAGVTESGLNQWVIHKLESGKCLELILKGVATNVGKYRNKATVEFASDSNPDNNFDDVTVNVKAKDSNDLGITKTANATSMLIGATVDFTITITNHGSNAVENIKVNDVWPSGLSLSAITAKENTTYAGMTWTIDSLNPGQSKTLILSAITTATGQITNTVEIMGIEAEYIDEDSSNDSDSEIITVNPQTITENPQTPTSSGGNTGRTSTPKVTPSETVIPVEEVPLTELIAVNPVIEDVAVPLADAADLVPQTGDSGNIWLLLALMLVSGAGIAVFRRRETE